MRRLPIFTDEELAELAAIDAELDAMPVSNEEVQESLRRDRAAAFAAKDNKRAKVAERQRRYREANKEKEAEYQRRYYEANKEKYAKKNAIHPGGTGRTEANRCGD